MRKLALLAAAVAMVGVASADAANVTFGISASSATAPTTGGPVTLTITAVIDDGTTTTDGLALWGADLALSGTGTLNASNFAIARPTANPMMAFDTNSGVTNPPHNNHGAGASGYQGTVSGTNLLQVGGGQNTIGNPGPTPAFPVGAVIEEVGAAGAVVVATGVYNVPAGSAGQTHTITLANCFANTIDNGEAGPTVYDVSAATTTCGANVTITLGGGARQVTSTTSRRTNPSGPGGFCDAVDNTSPFKVTEMHSGGITQVLIGVDSAFAVASGNQTNTAEVNLFSATCPTGTFSDDVTSTFTWSTSGTNVLTINFAPALTNLRTYRIDLGGTLGMAASQTVQIRGLVGDSNASGLVDGGDRTAIVAEWTDPSLPRFTCVTDVNNSGATDGGDRTAVVSAWTNPPAGVGNCAP